MRIISATLKNKKEIRMKKPFKHTELSDKHTCRICGKGIKLNLVKIKPTVPRLCYKHFMNKEGKV